MKLHYYPETDSLYIELKRGPGAETRKIVEGLVVDLDAEGGVVGFDIDHASRKFDLSVVETIGLPPAAGLADLKGLLAAAPLDGIDLSRERDIERRSPPDYRRRR